HDVDALHDGHHEGQPEREGDEEEVVHRGQRELQPRQFYDCRIDHGLATSWDSAVWVAGRVGLRGVMMRPTTSNSLDSDQCMKGSPGQSYANCCAGATACRRRPMGNLYNAGAPLPSQPRYREPGHRPTQSRSAAAESPPALA